MFHPQATSKPESSHFMRKIGKLRKVRKGVLSLEMTLVLPILLLVVLAVIQLSTYLLASQAIQAAALVGAREATLPGATSQSVNLAIHQALDGWRFERSVGPDDVVIKPNDWQTAPSGERVGVKVSVDAKDAALNALMRLAGFAWTDEKICGQYIMRKE